MSDSHARGWDDPTDGAEPLPLCDHHASTTDRLSTSNANLVARQAPCCIALRHAVNT